MCPDSGQKGTNVTVVDWIVAVWILLMGAVAAGMALVARWYSQESERWRLRWLEERAKRLEADEW
jgi:hypothetical protein